MFKILVLLCLVSITFGQLGGFTEQNLKEPVTLKRAQDLANFGLTKIASQRGQATGNIKLQYAIINVSSFKTQVVAGTNNVIELEMQDALCKASCKSELCTVTVYERSWENFRNLTNFSCTFKNPSNLSPLPSTPSNNPSTSSSTRPILGGMVRIPNNDSSALSTFNAVIASINNAMSDPNYYKAGMIKTYRQVVNGIRYIFVYTFQKSDCVKTSSSPNLSTVDVTSKCNLVKDADQVFCRLSVYVPLNAPTNSFIINDRTCF